MEFIGKRRGRPKVKWKDQVERGTTIMKIGGWRILTNNRKEWKKIVKIAKAHQGL